MRFLLLLVLVASALEAHKLSLFVTDEDGTLFVRSYFTRSAPCRECAVTIASVDGATLHELKTDENGAASIAVSALEVVVSVDGGSGHFAKQEYTLSDRGAKAEEPNEHRLVKILSALALIALFFWGFSFSKRYSRNREDHFGANA
ncbi:hypothetical protein AGMMS50229_02920 [Campylobacterota bacterium]|nr:hypothetical protein AGMMS50229_02920 [Campylobacterota bacterium]